MTTFEYVVGINSNVRLVQSLVLQRSDAFAESLARAAVLGRAGERAVRPSRDIEAPRLGQTLLGTHRLVPDLSICACFAW